MGAKAKGLLVTVGAVVVQSGRDIRVWGGSAGDRLGAVTARCCDAFDVSGSRCQIVHWASPQLLAACLWKVAQRNVKNIKKLSEQELKRGVVKSSWHDQYKDSAWVFVGGLPYDLTEGDIICVFSQYGEIVNINLVRDKETGKSKGFCFLCYEDQRSTALAVDNFNSIKILGRTIRVDHVADYKVPKDSDKLDMETKRLYAEGCAPKPINLNEDSQKSDDITEIPIKKIKKEKKEKKKNKLKKHKSKEKKKKMKKKVSSTSESSSSETSDSSESESDDESMKEARKRKLKKKDQKKSKVKKAKVKRVSSSEDDTNSSSSEEDDDKSQTKRHKLSKQSHAHDSSHNSAKAGVNRKPHKESSLSGKKKKVESSDTSSEEDQNSDSESDSRQKAKRENHDSRTEKAERKDSQKHSNHNDNLEQGNKGGGSGHKSKSDLAARSNGRGRGDHHSGDSRASHDDAKFQSKHSDESDRRGRKH